MRPELMPNAVSCRGFFASAGGTGTGDVFSLRESPCICLPWHLPLGRSDWILTAVGNDTSGLPAIYFVRTEVDSCMSPALEVVFSSSCVEYPGW